MLGPFQPGSILGFHLNQMGIVPEGHTPGHVEADHGSTTAFRPSWARYTSMEAVAAVARQLGTGALLAKLDIKAAYLLVPVHPNDHRLRLITDQQRHSVRVGLAALYNPWKWWQLAIKAAYLLVPVHPNDHRLWGLSGMAGTMLTSAQPLRSSQQWLMFYSGR